MCRGPLPMLISPTTSTAVACDARRRSVTVRSGCTSGERNAFTGVAIRGFVPSVGDVPCENRAHAVSSTSTGSFDAGAELFMAAGLGHEIEYAVHDRSLRASRLQPRRNHFERIHSVFPIVWNITRASGAICKRRHHGSCGWRFLFQSLGDQIKDLGIHSTDKDIAHLEQAKPDLYRIRILVGAFNTRPALV